MFTSHFPYLRAELALQLYPSTQSIFVDFHLPDRVTLATNISSWHTRAFLRHPLAFLRIMCWPFSKLRCGEKDKQDTIQAAPVFEVVRKTKVAGPKHSRNDSFLSHDGVSLPAQVVLSIGVLLPLMLDPS